MHYEQVTYSGGRIDHIHTLYAGAEVIGQYTTTNQSGVPPASTRYFGTDPLGSVVVLTNETGVLTDRYAYDPWGKRQVLSGSSDATDTGFTGQEQLAVGLVQLNGQLYDPVLGRMVSADPVIENTHDLQSYNGYTYVMNNPLGLTDPSGYFSLGHFFKSLFKFSVNPSPRNTFNLIHNQPGQQYVDGYIMTHQWAYAAGQIVATYYGGLIGAAAWSSYYTYQTTGSVNAALRSGAVTYATAVAFQRVGDLGVDANGSVVPGWEPGSLNMVFTHALVGGATSAAAGGSFKDGFLSAGFAEAAVPLISRIDSGNTGPDIGRTMAAAIAGGTASEIGGGNFANGAVTAAFAYMFNESGHAPKISGRGLIGDNLPDWLTGDSSKPFEGDVCMSAICVISGRPVKVIDWLPRNPLYTEMPSNCKCTEIREPQLYDPTGANNPFRK